MLIIETAIDKFSIIIGITDLSKSYLSNSTVLRIVNFLFS